MMSFSRQEIESLLRLVSLTGEQEINCEQCLALVAEFAERQLAGKAVSAGLDAVEQHLKVCAECREEYDLLRRTLDEMDQSSD